MNTQRGSSTHGYTHLLRRLRRYPMLSVALLIGFAFQYQRYSGSTVGVTRRRYLHTGAQVHQQLPAAAARVSYRSSSWSTVSTLTVDLQHSAGELASTAPGVAQQSGSSSRVSDLTASTTAGIGFPSGPSTDLSGSSKCSEMTSSSKQLHGPVQL